MANDAGIHPAPVEFTDAEIAQDPILHFFHYGHLPPVLRATSGAFATLARHVVSTVPRNAERTVALRKLLEAKDAAVRANLPAPSCPHTRIYAGEGEQLGKCTACESFVSASGYAQSAAAAPGFLTKIERDFHTNQPIGEPVEVGGHDEDNSGPLPFQG